MTGFTDLEVTVLRAIFLETPDLAPALERQLDASVITERENSGGDFFTTIAVADDAPAVNSPSVLGYDIRLVVKCLSCLLSMKGAHLFISLGA